MVDCWPESRGKIADPIINIVRIVDFMYDLLQIKIIKSKCVIDLLSLLRPNYNLWVKK